MKIRTQFSVGDGVWFMKDNAVNYSDITELQVKVNTGGMDEYYCLVGIDRRLPVSELFATKQDLLNHVFNYE